MKPTTKARLRMAGWILLLPFKGIAMAFFVYTFPVWLILAGFGEIVQDIWDAGAAKWREIQRETT